MILLALGCTFATIEDGGAFPILAAFSFPAWQADFVSIMNVNEPSSPSSFGHVVMLSDVSMECARQQAYQAAWNSASEDILAASDDRTDTAAFCSGVPDFLDRMDAAFAALPQQSQRVTFSFCADGGEENPCGGDVRSGDYDVPNLDGEPQVYAGYVRDRVADPAPRGPLWDSDACEYGADLPSLSGSEAYELSGSVTVVAGDGQALAGSWDGRVNAADGDGELDGGALDGTFVTTLCEVPSTKTLVLW